MCQKQKILILVVFRQQFYNQVLFEMNLNLNKFWYFYRYFYYRFMYIKKCARKYMGLKKVAEMETIANK